MRTRWWGPCACAHHATKPVGQKGRRDEFTNRSDIDDTGAVRAAPQPEPAVHQQAGKGPRAGDGRAARRPPGQRRRAGRGPPEGSVHWPCPVRFRSPTRPKTSRESAYPVSEHSKRPILAVPHTWMRNRCGHPGALPRSAIPVYAVNRRHSKKQSSKTSTCAFRRWSRSLMPKLPRISSRRLLQVLLRAGFYVHHQTGSHVNLRHCTKSHLHVVVPRHSRDLAPKTIKSVIIQAETTVEELARLLGA